MGKCTRDVPIGPESRHSLIAYIPIKQRSGKGCIPAVPLGSAYVVDAAKYDIISFLFVPNLRIDTEQLLVAEYLSIRPNILRHGWI